MAVERFKFDFILHWIWSAVFGLMLLTGLALLGPKYGWVLDYNLGLADYLHRTFAVILTILFLIEIVFEIRRLMTKKRNTTPWVVVGKGGFALLTFIAAQLLIISGVLMWLCLDDNHAVLALASIIHETVTYAMVVGVVWHLFEKSYVLILGGGRRKLE